MQTHFYRCRDPQRQLKEGLLEAANARQARQTLEDRGWTVLELTRVGGTAEAPESPTGGGLLALDLRARFFLELSILVGSGVHLVEALEFTGGDEEERLAQVCAQIARDVSEGRELSQSMDRSGAFERSSVGLVHLGEKSGRLVGILQRLSANLNERRQRNKRLIGQLTYPLFLAVGVTLMVMLLIGYLVPQVNQLVLSLGVPMPALTQWVVAAFQPRHLMIVMGLGALLAGLLVAAWFSPSGPALRQQVVETIPPLRRLVGRKLLVDFCRNLTLLLDVGFDWNRALLLTQTGVAFFDRQVEEFRKALCREDFVAALESCDSFDPVLKGLMGVGYESNRITPLLHLYADFSQEEFDQRLELLLSLLEPAVLLILGALVGLVVTASFLPMMGLLTKL